MKLSLKLSALALASLSLAACSTGSLEGLTQAASSNSSASTLSTAADVLGKLDSKSAKTYLDIAKGALSNDKLQALLKTAGLDAYVKNAAALTLAKNLLTGSTDTAASSASSATSTSGVAAKVKDALSYFDSSKADSSQSSLFESLKSQVAKLK